MAVIINRDIRPIDGVGGSASPTAPLVVFIRMGRYIIDLKRIGEIMSDPNYSDAEKVLLYIISDHYQYCLNFGKECKMSYSVLRQRTGWWNDKIQKIIELLKSKKLVSVETHRVNGKQNTPMVFTSALVECSENRNTNQVKSEYECSENRNTSVPKIGKNNNTYQHNNNNGDRRMDIYTEEVMSSEADAEFLEQTFANNNQQA